MVRHSALLRPFVYAYPPENSCRDNLLSNNPVTRKRLARTPDYKLQQQKQWFP